MFPATTRMRVSLLAGLLLGLVGSAVTPACIIPDYCIVVQTHGSDWCVNAEGAQMWPVGQPQLAEPILDNNQSPPKGCHCYNDGEVQILGQGVPAGQHAALVAELQQAARAECAWTVPPGYDHNCFIDDEVLGPSFSEPFFGGESDDCVGSCAYVNDPPFGSCEDDPNPWECNDEDPGRVDTGDTSGGDTGTGGSDTSDTSPFDGIDRIVQ